MDVRSQRAPDGCAEDRTDSFRMWRDGRVVDKFAGSKLEQLIQVGSVGPERAKHMEVRSQRAPDGCAEDRTDSFRMWRDGRVVEGAPLLRVYGSKAHRGFESLSLRQSGMKKARSVGPFSFQLRSRGIEPSRFEGSTSSPGANLIAASQDEAATRRAKRMDARSRPSLSASHKQKGPLLRALLFVTRRGIRALETRGFDKFAGRKFGHRFGTRSDGQWVQHRDVRNHPLSASLDEKGGPFCCRSRRRWHSPARYDHPSGRDWPRLQVRAVISA